LIGHHTPRGHVRCLEPVDGRAADAIEKYAITKRPALTKMI